MPGYKAEKISKEDYEKIVKQSVEIATIKIRKHIRIKSWINFRVESKHNNNLLLIA